jgi:hypothetical protein
MRQRESTTPTRLSTRIDAYVLRKRRGMDEVDEGARCGADVGAGRRAALYTLAPPSDAARFYGNQS